MKRFYMLTVKKMAEVRNLDSISGTYNGLEICTSKNYARKSINKFYNYEFIFPASLAI